MSNIERFYKEGYVKLNLERKPFVDCPIMCVNKGIWYTFRVDEINELEDGTFDIISRTLLKIDEKLVK